METKQQVAWRFKNWKEGKFQHMRTSEVAINNTINLFKKVVSQTENLF